MTKRQQKPKGTPCPNGSARRALFVVEYLKDRNATQAAVRAGYSPHTAKMQGSRLMTYDAIRREIEQRTKKIDDKLEIDAERILAELSKIAFSDMRKFTTWGSRGVRLIDSESLTDDEARCVSEVSQTTTKDGGSIKFKLHDKKGALELLGKHLKMFTDKVEHGLTDELKELLTLSRDA